jgi:hypothetical protein
MQTAIIKTTAEEIVRQHRQEWLRRHREETPRRDDSEKMNEPFFPISPSPPHPIGLNWGLIFEVGCWAVLAGCLLYLGIFVFGPFAIRLVTE